ncbi:MAG TPA: HAMP domain-containing sensor histidine kinase [Acidimicrobiales bacterium]|nr:HAMP domain-containing sensor histidine kinase [Acidimicrobiales bacterium]
MSGGVGLRWRLTAAFAIGALVVSAGLAIVTYQTARAYLLRQREASALRQAFVNARLVAVSLQAEPEDPSGLLSSVETGSGSRAVLRYHDRWYGYPVGVGPDSLPDSVVTEAVAGFAARQRSRQNGDAQLTVAVPIPARRALYFEIFSLDQLEVTLALLRNTLLAAATATTVVGALFGLVAAGRVLRPVREVSRAAAEVAAGNLDIRLDDRGGAELGQLADSFNTMTEALRQRIERDQRFVSAVSHELRSPLTTLTAAVEVVNARRAELPDRARVAVDLVVSEVNRFNRMVQDLLEISRLGAGAVELPDEEVAVGPLLLHAVNSLDVGTAEVDIAGDAYEACVRADKRRFERIIGNLVENAFLYGGGVTRIALDRRESIVRITVDDAGPGLTEEERERIFEPFLRGEAAKSRGAGSGTGLGLSIVAEHVALHRGRVWAESSDAGGARFVVELPVARP